MEEKSIRWSSSIGNDDEYTFAIDGLINIVTVDLANAYQCRGKDILNQIHGCPIGGFLSAIYANVKCAFDEHMFLNKIGTLRNRLFGIRQMDDLLLFIAYKDNDHLSLTEAHTLKKHVLAINVTYKGGLELEEQECVKANKYISVHKFSGNLITVIQAQDFR